MGLYHPVSRAGNQMGLVGRLVNIAYAFTRRILCRIGANVYLYSFACSFLHDVEQVSCCCGIQIGFAAGLADLSGNILKDHRGSVPLKRHGGGSWLGFPLLANDAFHGFFLFDDPLA